MLRVKKFFVFAACVVLIGLASSGCGREKEPGRYYNRAEDFSLKLPEEWETREGMMGTAVIALGSPAGPPDKFRENVNVVVERLPRSMSAKEYDAAAQGTLTMMAGFASADRGTGNIDGREAVWGVYSHKMMKVRMKVLMYVVVRGRKAYVITCTTLPDAFDEHEPVFQKIVRSFRFE